MKDNIISRELSRIKTPEISKERMYNEILKKADNNRKRKRNNTMKNIWKFALAGAGLAACITLAAIAVPALNTQPQVTQNTVAMVTPYATQETQNPPTPSPPEATGEPERYMTFYSREEFINEVNRVKQIGCKTNPKLEEIEFYYDFKNLVKEVELDSIYVTPNCVDLIYRDKEAKEFFTLSLSCRKSPINEDEEQYLRKFQGYADIGEFMINGHKVLKDELHYDNELTGLKNEHVGNQYIWVENGISMLLRIPTWLLECYPEETFFDIRKVEITKPGETN